MSLLDKKERSRKNAAIARHLALLTDPARILCSYPRSGSFWLRSMLYDYNSLLHGQRFAPTRPFFLKYLARLAGAKLSPSRPPQLGYFSPQIELPSFPEYFKAGRRDQRLVKTHLPMTAWEEYAANKQILILFRNPSDCLVSAFKKRSSTAHRRNATGDIKSDKKSHVKELAQLGIDDFAKRQVIPWARHAQSFLDYASAHPGKLKFVSYERLKRETESCLAGILSFYELPVDASRITAVVENRRISKVKAKLGTVRENININTGRVGDAKNLLAPETLEQVEEETADLWQRLQELDT